MLVPKTNPNTPFYVGDTVGPNNVSTSSKIERPLSSFPSSSTTKNSGSTLYKENVTITRALNLHSWTLNSRKQTTVLRPGETDLNVLYKTPTEHQLIRGHVFFTFNQSTLLDKAYTNYALGGNGIQGSMTNEKVVGAEWGKVNEIIKDGFNQQMSLLSQVGFNVYHSFMNRSGRSSSGVARSMVDSSVSHPDSYRSSSSNDKNSVSLEVHVPVYDQTNNSMITHVDIFKYFYEEILNYNHLEVRKVNGHILLKHFEILSDRVENNGSFEPSDFSLVYTKNDEKKCLKSIPDETDILKAYRRRNFCWIMTQADDGLFEHKESEAHGRMISSIFEKTQELQRSSASKTREFLVNLRNLFYDALCNYFGAEHYVRFCTCKGVMDTWNFFGVPLQGIESHPNTVIPGFDDSARLYPMKNFAVAGRTDIMNRWGPYLMAGDTLYIILKKKTKTSPFQFLPFHPRSANELLKNNKDGPMTPNGSQINKFKEACHYPMDYMINYKDFNGTVKKGAVLPIGKVIQTHDSDVSDEVRAWSIAINPRNHLEPISNEQAVSTSRPLWNDRFVIALRFL